MDIEVLDADQWELLSEARLEALEESPTAFLSSYRTVRSWREPQWRGTFRRARWIVAREGARIVGMAHSLQVPDRPADERHIESVWVSPQHRRAGILTAIITFLLCAEAGVHDWLVWVIEGNTIDGDITAREIYERLGFESTGERQPLPDSSGRIEERLKLQRAS